MTTTPAPRRTGSHTSLTHLTLAPLSTGRPLIDASDYDEPNDSHTYASSPPRSRRPSTDDDLVSPAPTAHFGQIYTRHNRPSSYLAARSVPATPGILSRSHSPSRGPTASKSYTHLVGAIESASATASGATTPAAAQSANPLDVAALRTKRDRERARLRKNAESSEWLYRHAAALTDSAREGKGQSWLEKRASGTNVASQPDEPPARTPWSPEIGRKSARASRRGSRANLAGLGMTSAMSTRFGTPSGAGARTPAGGRTPALSEGGDYFGLRRGVEGPDFVDGVEEDEDDRDESFDMATHDEQAREQAADDEEIAELAWASSGFGLGGLVDKFVGWTLFDVGSGEGRREEEEERMREEETSRLKRVRQSQVELARLAKAERRLTSVKENKREEMGKERVGEESAGWSDAAWLLSVASKAIF